MYLRKYVQFFMNTPFSRTDALLLPVGSFTTPMAKYAASPLLDLGEQNIRINEDGVITVLSSVAFPSIRDVLKTIAQVNYMRLDVEMKAPSGVYSERFWYFVTGYEICDTETTAERSYDVGAVRFFLQLDALTTWGNRETVKAYGGDLYAYSSAEFLQNVLKLNESVLQKKLPLEPVVKTQTPRGIEANYTNNPTEEFRIYREIPQSMRPFYWIFYNTKLAENITQAQTKYRVCVICTSAKGGVAATHTFASAPLDYNELINVADEVGGGTVLYEADEGSTTEFTNKGKITIKHVYLIPAQLLEVYDSFNTYPQSNKAYRITAKDTLPDDYNLNLWRVKLKTVYDEHYIDAPTPSQQITIGTPFKRIKIENLGRTATRQLVSITCSAGGDSMRIAIETDAENVDITQDFEYLTATDLSNKYWQENKSAIALQAIATTGTLIGGIATGNPIAVGGALLSGAQQINNVSQNLKQAPQTAGGGYADITILYGGVYWLTFDASNAQAVEDAILTQGIQTFAAIRGAWDISQATLGAITEKRFFVKADNVHFTGLPRENAEALAERFAAGVTIYTDLTQFEQRS